MRINSKVWQSRIFIVLMGIGLGWCARFIHAPETEENLPTRTFSEPLPDEVPVDFPIENHSDSTSSIQDFWVEPFSLNSGLHDLDVKTETSVASATFEPHGEQVCASGCALSRNPTESLSSTKFHQLFGEYCAHQLNQNSALDSLLYFGPQTQRHLDAIEADDSMAKSLNAKRVRFLKQQLKFTHAEIAIRVREEDENWSWLAPTIVPLDRRHVFHMNSRRLQPLETSGTLKRVGLNHVWTRL